MSHYFKIASPAKAGSQRRTPLSLVFASVAKQSWFVFATPAKAGGSNLVGWTPACAGVRRARLNVRRFQTV